MDLLTRLRSWRRLKADLTADSAADIPDWLPTRRAVIVGPSNHRKWLIFDCPCGRGHRVMLNLDAGTRPRWHVTETYPLTLSPSVDEHSTVGHCHYVIREGRVHWIERTEHR